jgi:serine/threonine-protein kinase
VYQVLVRHKDGFSHVAAVKLLHNKWMDNEEISCRMRDEARLLGLLRHRNIVHVMDLTSIDGRTAIVMEYLEAIHLKSAIDSITQRGEAMPVRAALEISACAAAALDAAYNRPPHPKAEPLRVVHRDIKPPNIMIDESGLVKVLDFGVARAEFAARESETQQLQFGSVDYMAPERLLFEAEGPESDVYSLGATLFECLTGEKLGRAKRVLIEHTAFVADRLSFLRAIRAVPGPGAMKLEGALKSALAFEASDRPSAQEMAVDLRHFARTLGGLSLQEWAEAEVPGMMSSFVPKTGREASFVGRAVDEDSTRFRTIESVEEGPGSLAPPVPSESLSHTSVQSPGFAARPPVPTVETKQPIGSVAPHSGPRPYSSQARARNPRKRSHYAPTPLDITKEMGGILAATLLPQDGPIWVSIVFGGLVSFATGLVMSSLLLLPFVRLVAFAVVTLAGGTDSSAVVDFHQRYLLTGGLSCEIPLILILLDRTQKVSAETLARHRLLLLAASLLMAWFATPRVTLSGVLPLAFWMWLLFELGIRASRRLN